MGVGPRATAGMSYCGKELLKNKSTLEYLLAGLFFLLPCHKLLASMALLCALCALKQSKELVLISGDLM